MKSGIYVITNITNQKVYVGSTKCFEKRWKRHLRDLRKGIHSSIKLQRSYNKHGEDNFVFSIVEEAPYTPCIVNLEDHYIKVFDSKRNGYNIADASFGDALTYHPNKADIIARASATARKNTAKLSEQERKDKWGRSGELNGMFGRTHSEEARKKISEIHKGNSYNKGLKRSLETRAKMSIIASNRLGDKNPFFGKHHSEKTKEASRQRKLGKKPTNTKIVIIDGIEYEGLTDASIATGIHYTTIAHRIKSSNPLYTEYSYKGEAKVEAIPRMSHNAIACSIDGRIFTSALQAAKSLDLSISAIINRIRSKNYPESFYL